MLAKRVLRSVMPRSVRSHRILRGPLRGRRIVTSWYDYPGAILGYTEDPLLRWLSSHVNHGDTWLDVGAHYGYTTLWLSQLVGPSGRVFAFEPVLATAGHLSVTKLLNVLNNVTVLPLALGKEEQLTRMDVPLVRGMAEHSQASTKLHETIFAIGFDKLWPQVNSGRTVVDGVKIDVQGMELEVLSGMKDVLRTFHPKLVVEIHHGVNRRELITLLESTGYMSQGAAVTSPDTPVAEYEDDASYVFGVGRR